MNDKTVMITEDRMPLHMRKNMRIGQRDTGKIGSTTVTTRMIKPWVHNGIKGTGKIGIVITRVSQIITISNDRTTGAGRTLIATTIDYPIIPNDGITGAGMTMIAITRDNQAITFVHGTTNRD